MKIIITKQTSGYFAYLETDPLIADSGSTPRKALERLMDKLPEMFGEKPVNEGEIHEAIAFGKEWGGP